MLHHRPRHQIRRSRFNASLRKHDGPRVLCLVLILFDHASNPWNLSSTVEVMGAGFSAKFENGLAIEAIGSNCGDDYKRLFNQGFQLSLIIDIGNLNAYMVTLIRYAFNVKICRAIPKWSRAIHTRRQSVRIQLLAFCDYCLKLRL